MRSTVARMLVLCLATLAVLERADATGALFGRQINSSALYQSMEIRTYDAQVSIHDGFAVTQVDQRCFNNLRATVEVTFVFPLPDGAFITHFAYWFNGTRYVATIKERQAAQKTYDSLVSRMIDPALLVDLGNNSFKLNVAPVHANTELRFELTYVELLRQRSGVTDFRFLLKTTGLSPTPLQRVSVIVDALSNRPFEWFEAPGRGTTPNTTLQRLDSNRYRAVFGDENYIPSDDLLVRFRTRHAPFDATVISYMPTDGDSLGPDGYYGLWVTLPDSLDDAQRPGRSIVFAADVSSSMMGERLDGLKKALGIFLDRLIPADRFNIVVFSTGVVPLRPDLVAATPSHLDDARRFVSELGASGLTNIDEALNRSLAMNYDSDPDRSVLIFMTDGSPTWGETDPDIIIDSTLARNNGRVRILPFGLGDDPSRALLNGLAARNNGYPTYMSTGAGFAESIRAFFQRVLLPTITDIDVDIEGLYAYDKAPEIPTTSEIGVGLVQFGRYGRGGEYPITGRGTIDTVGISLRTSGSFFDTTGGEAAIALLWARAKIDDLLRQIGVYGEKEELVDAVIFLSIRYGILTPYTALYADPNDPKPTAAPNDRLVSLRLSIESIAPNPMRERTVVTWHMPQWESRRATVEVLTTTGQIIRRLFDGNASAGRQSTVWDGLGDNGLRVPAGVYFMRITAGDQKRAEKIVVIW